MRSKPWIMPRLSALSALCATLLVGCSRGPEGKEGTRNEPASLSSSAPLASSGAPRSPGSAGALPSTAPASAAPGAAAQASRCAGVTCVSIERCDEATGACVGSCPPGEVYIPATGPGGFTMGKGFTTNGGAQRLGKGHQPDSDRPHKVVLTRPFCMDEAEVTVAAMKSCVDAGKCESPKTGTGGANYPQRLDHPVNDTSWPKAKQFCLAQGKDLPTEAQWEWAATGGDGRKWPWGDEQPTCEHADFVIGVLVSPSGDSGCGGGGTSPVKSKPKGNKVWPGGALYDLAGNVWEWCDDTFSSYPATEVADPRVQDPKVRVHVVRGGGWNRSVLGIQTMFRGAAITSYEVPGLGFRCVRNP